MDDPLGDTMKDGYAPADQIAARMVDRITQELADPDKLPYLGSVRPKRARRCLRQMNLASSYPTPLIIQATKNELVLEAAIQGTRPGGRVALILEALRIVTGQEGERGKKGGLWSRLFHGKRDQVKDA